MNPSHISPSALATSTGPQLAYRSEMYLWIHLVHLIPGENSVLAASLNEREI